MISAQRQSTRPFKFPAPSGGANSISPLFDMPIQDAIVSYNVVAHERGVETREGWSVFAEGLGANTVLTLIPHEDLDPADNKLYGVTADGIYDITAGGGSPSLDLSFLSTSGDAGYGSWVNFTNDAGAHFTIYADEENGLHEYDTVSGWVVKSDVTGVAEVDIVQLLLYKNRIWMVEKNTASGWYLGTGLKGGAATEFNFGNKFTHGGHLVGLYSFTMDGGDGTDDYLVSISSAGDIVVYSGTDPASASTWRLVGSWYAGPPPAGRRIAAGFGGDLYVVTNFGLISMHQLMRGVELSDPRTQVSFKIAEPIRRKVAETANLLGWEIAVYSGDSKLVISSPEIAANEHTQYVQDLVKQSWGFWRGLSIHSLLDYRGSFYFGTEVGTVARVNGDLDGVQLDGTGGEPVEFWFLTAYSDMDAPGQNKRVHHIQPFYLSSTAVDAAFFVQAFYDFNLNEIAGSPSLSITASDLWDTGLWDSAIWQGGETSKEFTVGATGVGSFVAIGVKGVAPSRVTILGFNVDYEAGGLL